MLGALVCRGAGSCRTVTAVVQWHHHDAGLEQRGCHCARTAYPYPHRAHRFRGVTFWTYLKPLVQSLANIPIPTPGPEQATRLQIPAIGVDAPIVQGDGWEQLKKGVGQHVGSANPGVAGNVVLSAHNDIFGEIFRHLDQLQPGDEITIYTNQRSYTYVVSESQVVEPTQVDIMDSTSQPTLTLISCYPYLVDDKRIAITSRLETGSN